MPIAVASSTTNTGSSDPFVTAFTAVENDVVVAVISLDNAAPTTPSGWTLVASNVLLRVYAKRMSSSPDSSFSIEAAGNSYGLCLYVMSGVDTTTLEDATAVTNTTTAVPNTSSITTATDLAWVLSAVSSLGTDATAAPSGYSNMLHTDQSGPCVGAAAWKEVSPAGAEDAGDWGMGSGQFWGAAWALRPAAAAAGSAKNMLLLGVG